jgi:hypothetical protein
MTSWHVIPDRSLGKVGIQVYQDGQFCQRIVLADVGIPEDEVGFLCSWLPEKLAADPSILPEVGVEQPDAVDYVDIGEKLMNWSGNEFSATYALKTAFMFTGKPPEENYPQLLWDATSELEPLQRSENIGPEDKDELAGILDFLEAEQRRVGEPPEEDVDEADIEVTLADDGEISPA